MEIVTFFFPQLTLFVKTDLQIVFSKIQNWKKKICRRLKLCCKLVLLQLNKCFLCSLLSCFKQSGWSPFHFFVLFIPTVKKKIPIVYFTMLIGISLEFVLLPHTVTFVFIAITQTSCLAFNCHDNSTVGLKVNVILQLLVCQSLLNQG